MVLFLYLTGMKLLLPALLFLFALTGRAQNTFELYLTHDLAINGCLLGFQDIKKDIFHAIRSGKLPLYATYDSSVLQKAAKPLSARLAAAQLNILLPGYDAANPDSNYVLPMSSIELRGMQAQTTGRMAVIKVVNTEIAGMETTVGYVQQQDLENYLSRGKKSLLQLLGQDKRLYHDSLLWSDNEIYTAALLGLVAQNQLLWEQAGKQPVYTTNFTPATRGELLIRTQTFDKDRNIIYTMPEDKLWKGNVAAGEIVNGIVTVKYFGLLFYPDHAFTGMDPGILPWFYFKKADLERNLHSTHDLLVYLTEMGLLYVIEPEKYRCEFYRANYIEIHNTRYGYKHRH